jgi:EpsI family protein
VAYAFFLRISNWKRLILICAAVPIAIFTNAIRVIVTGILAQYWGARAAEGFFHEFAGLMVFVMAMVMLVSLGALLGKRGEAGKRGKGESVPHPPITSLSLSRFATVCILLTAAALYLNLHKDLDVPMNKSFTMFPQTVSGWHMTQEFPMSEDVQKVLMATDTLTRRYETVDGKSVDLYIGYHGGGKDSGEIHSPKHCLPGSGWFEISTKRRLLDVSGTKVNLVQAIYQKGGSRQLFLYWFQVQDKTINDEYSLKMAEILNSILYRRRDAAFIRISVPFEADEQATLALGERFARDMFPIIRGFLPV